MSPMWALSSGFATKTLGYIYVFRIYVNEMDIPPFTQNDRHKITLLLTCRSLSHFNMAPTLPFACNHSV